MRLPLCYNRCPKYLLIYLIVVVNKMLLRFAVADDATVVVVVDVRVKVGSVIFGRIFRVESTLMVIGLRHRLRSERDVATRRSHRPREAWRYLDKK